MYVLTKLAVCPWLSDQRVTNKKKKSNFPGDRRSVGTVNHTKTKITVGSLVLRMLKGINGAGAGQKNMCEAGSDRIYFSCSSSGWVSSNRRFFGRGVFLFK